MAGLVIMVVVFTLAGIYTYDNARYAPWQVHLALARGSNSSDGVTVMWYRLLGSAHSRLPRNLLIALVTGAGNLRVTESRDTRSEVEWGLLSEGEAHMRLAQGNSTAYVHRSYSSGCAASPPEY
jgi:hypothetical protein